MGIVRVETIARGIEIAQGCIDGGVDVLEISYTNNNAGEVIRALKEKFGDQLLVGAGTVLDPTTARLAIMDGAEFIIAPTFNKEVQEMANLYQIPYAPGCTSYTEMIEALKAGASFIKAFPEKFAEHRNGVSPDRLVNLVCNRLLNQPINDRPLHIIQPRRENTPFRLDDYDIHRFDVNDRETHKRFYPYFKNRGIDIFTQRAFADHFFLATRHRSDGLAYANLAFPLVLPKEPDKIAGLEERGRPKMDGSGSYKGKAEGSNSSEGLWIANFSGEPLQKAGGVAWFESAYDAMAFYQIHRNGFRDNPDLSKKSVFVSTGGTPTDMQIRGMLSVTPDINHYLCFDNDSAGREFVKKFQAIAESMHISSDRIKVFPLMPCYKDWNDALLGKTSEEYLDSIKDAIVPLGAPLGTTGYATDKEEEHRQPNIHR